MFIRNCNMNMNKISINDYITEKQFYCAIWKIKYNISISKKDSFSISSIIKNK